MDINTTTVVAVNEEKFLKSELGEELVMMNLESGNFFELNEVGSDILKQIEQPISIADIVNNVMEMYEVEQQACEADVIAYVTDLVTKNVLVVAS